MTIYAIRFRMEGELCVLQVLEADDNNGYGHYQRSASWRDAKATDLLVVAKFTSDYRELHDRVEGLCGQIDQLMHREVA
jgi:predicted DNA binding protein